MLSDDPDSPDGGRPPGGPAGSPGGLSRWELSSDGGLAVPESPSGDSFASGSTSGAGGLSCPGPPSVDSEASTSGRDCLGGRLGSDRRLLNVRNHPRAMITSGPWFASPFAISTFAGGSGSISLAARDGSSPLP